MKTVYRGTMRRELGGVRGSPSWCYSLPIAIVWSARPPDVWSGRPPAFLETSTVHVAEVSGRSVLHLDGSTFVSFAEILAALRFGQKGGISVDEATRVLTYLHNRLTGKAKGGEYEFKIVDERGRRVRDDVGLFSSHTPVSLLREEWESDPSIETAERLEADTFVFVDAPRFQEVARRLGYDAVTYDDTFEGGGLAAKALLGRELGAADGVRSAHGLEGRRVPSHSTYRPLVESAVRDVASMPAAEAVEAWRGRGRAAGRARRR